MAETRQPTGNLFMRATIPIVILAAGIGTFLLLSKLLKSEPATASESSKVAEVKVATVIRREGGFTIEADGLVVPYREINLSAEVAGRVDKREENCRAGNFVKAGTLLFAIDRRDYELEVQRLTKELKQATIAEQELAEEIKGAESLIEIARKQLDLRIRESRRWDELAENFRNSADLETAEASELAAENAYTTLQNRASLLNISQRRMESAKEIAQAKLDKANLDLKRTEIVAPVDGVVVADYVEQDSFVQRGTQLLTLEDTAKVEVKSKLEMEDLYWLWDRSSDSAKPATTQTASQAYDIPEVDVEVIYRLTGRNDLEFIWNGRLSRYDGIGIDQKTRTVPCRVVVDDPRRRVVVDKSEDRLDGEARSPELAEGVQNWVDDRRSGPPALVRGMYVSVRFKVLPKTPLLELPEIAVQPGNVVWVVRDGKLIIERVNFVSLIPPAREIPATFDDVHRNIHDALIYVEPPNSLTADEQVVISPLSFVRSGMNVSVVRTEKKK